MKDKKELISKFPKDLQTEIKETVRCKDYTEESLAQLQLNLKNILESKSNQGKRTDLTSPQQEGDVKAAHEKTLNEIGNIFNEGKETIRKRLLILVNSQKNPKYKILLKDIDNPLKKQTINSVYKELQKEEKKKLKLKLLEKIQIKLPSSIQLYNTSFEKVEIPANSVSLTMTDPDYTDYNVQVYSDLAKKAMIVLKDGGSVLCYVGHYMLDTVITAMKKEGLNYHWLIPVIHSGPSALMFSKKILVGYKPLLWMVKGKYDGGHVKDVIQSEFQGKELHEWAQSTVESDYYIKHMTEENEIIWDPFMGQGTFLISAAKLNRQIIGSDIDTEKFEIASKLISQASSTQQTSKKTVTAI